MTAWIVGPPPRPLTGEVRVPGDKSIGHRAVLFAALCEDAVPVSGLSGGEDNRRTMDALRALGVRIDAVAPGQVTVHGVGLDGLRAPAAPLDCGNSGTSMRLLSGILAAQGFASRLVGDPYLSRRPMRRVVDPLAQMGARIAGAAGAKADEVYPPLDITGGPLAGIDYVMPVASAQVKSAVLLAGLWARGTTTVREPGPTRDHTERMLAALGAPLDRPEPGVARVRPDGWSRRLSARAWNVPGDPSSAAFLVVAALLGGAGVRVLGVCVNPTRTGFIDALRAMGAELGVENQREEAGEPIADLVVPAAQRLRAARLAGDVIVRAIDEVPVLAVAAATAVGETEIADAHELRVKESDRIATTCALLRAFGVTVTEADDGLRIRGGSLRGGGRVHARGDHRIAMAGAIAGLAADGETRIDDVDNVATSFPSFVACVEALGGQITELTGPAEGIRER